MTERDNAHKRALAARLRTGRTLVAIVALVTFTAAACGSDGESEPTPDDLIGTWSSQELGTWQIDDDSIIITGGFVDENSYSATSTTLEMTDVSGEFACPPSQVGNYGWQIVDDVLTLTLIDDACAGRGEALDGISLTRQ